jgi:hypothetical protein
MASQSMAHSRLSTLKNVQAHSFLESPVSATSDVREPMLVKTPFIGEFNSEFG